MPPTSKLTKIVRRLSVLRGWNALLPEAKEELERTICDLAIDEQHAEHIVTAWLRTKSEIPTPVELHEAAAAIQAVQVGKPDDACPDCSGTGFAHAQWLVTHSASWRPGHRDPGAEWRKIPADELEACRASLDAPRQALIEGVRPCGCQYGRALAAARKRVTA